MNYLNLSHRNSTIAQTAIATEEEQRRKLSADDEAIYFGFRKEVEALVAAELKRTTKIELNKIPWMKIDIATRLIDLMAMIYKSPAIRTAGDGQESKGAKDYQEVLKNSNINTAAPQWDALARLHNTVLVRPYYYADTGQVEFRIYTPAHTDVISDEIDHRKPELVRYWVDRRNGAGTYEAVAYEWTADTAIKIDGNQGVPMEGLETTANPYGILPFAVLRLREMGEFWGEGASDITSGSIQWLAQLAGLLKNGQDQSFSILLAINTGLGKVALASEVGTASTVEIGSSTVIAAEGISKEDPQPSLEYVTPDPKLDELVKILNSILKVLCWRYGISASRAVDLISGAVGVSSESGVAKSLDNADLEELRSRDLEAYRNFEKDLYKVLRVVMRVDAKIELPEEFRIDFGELAVKQTQAEQHADHDHKVKYNLATPIDFIMEANPDLTEKEAQKIYDDNKKLNEELMASDVIRESL
jgi:hypothetical protein